MPRGLKNKKHLLSKTDYQECEGTCEEEKATACLSELSSQMDSDLLLLISTKPHLFWEWELVLQHAANRNENSHKIQLK